MEHQQVQRRDFCCALSGFRRHPWAGGFSLPRSARQLLYGRRPRLIPGELVSNRQSQRTDNHSHLARLQQLVTADLPTHSSQPRTDELGFVRVQELIDFLARQLTS